MPWKVPRRGTKYGRIKRKEEQGRVEDTGRVGFAHLPGADPALLEVEDGVRSPDRRWGDGRASRGKWALPGTARGLIRSLQPEKRSTSSQQMGPFATLAET